MSKVLSVSQLNNYIKGVFLDEILLHNIEVFGEITEFNVSGGNTFITVREGDCVLSCIKFGIFEKLRIGMKILLDGSVTFYEKGGRISFVAREIKPYGEGEEFLKLRQLKDKLKSEGLFENRARLPKRIGSIAVITSVAGAVIHDILGILENRIKLDVYICDVRVQGDGAAIEIVEAINTVNESLPVDCIIIARGGGAFTDLNVFNEESIARAVANSHIPVVSAVGHETDYTLCDLCAGTRAGTPSIAAELVASVNDVLYNTVTDYAKAMNRAVYDKLISAERRLYKNCHSISVMSERRIANSYNAVKHISERLSTAIGNKLDASYLRVCNEVTSVNLHIETLVETKERRYSEADKKLEMINPLKILSKGYARIQKDGKPVSSAKEIRKNDDIDIIMSDGILSANITDNKSL